MGAKDDIVAISVVTRQVQDGEGVATAPYFQLKTRGGAFRTQRFRLYGLGFGSQLRSLRARYPGAKWDPYSRSRAGTESWLVWLPTGALSSLAGNLALVLVILPWMSLVLPFYIRMAGYFGRPKIDMIGVVVVLLLPIAFMSWAVRLTLAALTRQRHRIALRDLGHLPLELKSPRNRMDHG